MSKITTFLFSCLLILAFPCNSQNSYSDSILSLEQTLSEKEFIQVVIDIPYDEAVKNMIAFNKLTDLAILKSLEINDSILLAKSYVKKARALHFSSKDQKAIDLTLNAIRIFESKKDIENSAKSYLELGWKLKHRRLEDAFFYMRKGMKELEKTTNTKDLVGAYNNIGVLYQMKRQNDSALYFHKKSLSLAKKLGDSIGIPFAHTEIAFVYIQKKEFPKAQKHLDSSLVMRIKRNDTYGIADSYLYLGDLFFAKKQYNKAIQNFQLGYDYADQNGYYPLKQYAVEYLYKSYESIEDFKSSLIYLKEYQQLKDSVLNKQTNAKVAELQIEFETTKKEKEIAEQALEIKNKTIMTLVLGGSIVIISMLFWSYHKRGKLKKRQLEREMELKEALAEIKTKNKLQEQRLEISRDLHDNIGSQLTFIISSIESLKYVSKDLGDLFQKKLSNISHFTSDTIHQLRDTIWAMNKSEISLDEFHSRLLSYVEKAKIAAQNTQFTVDNHGNDFILSSVKGMHLFRVIQEAVNNSIKYANARSISITLDQNGSQLSILILDDGIGFQKELISEGNGLLNMEARVQKIGGMISIESEKEKGTKINIQLIEE